MAPGNHGHQPPESTTSFQQDFAQSVFPLYRNTRGAFLCYSTDTDEAGHKYFSLTFRQTLLSWSESERASVMSQIKSGRMSTVKENEWQQRDASRNTFPLQHRKIYLQDVYPQPFLHCSRIINNSLNWATGLFQLSHR